MAEISFVALLVLLALAIFIAARVMRRDDPQSLLMMQEQINALRGEIAQRLDGNATVVNQHLQHVQSSLQGILPRLGSLDKANENLLQVSKSIEEFQKNLLVPKFRGGVGETILENILSQMLPREHYDLQYTFKTGKRADAVVRLANSRCVAVDAKFPLQSFLRITGEAAGEERASLKKQFVRDVKKHIDKIAADYILPDEGTLDFAMMYIPVEGVYYEAIIRDESENEPLFDYAMAKKVMPVSPNTIFAYLQTVIIGLSALRIENSARKIIDDLTRLRNDFNTLAESLNLAGKHLNNLRTAHENTERLASDIKAKIDKI